MASNPLLSVVIPAYNVEAWLGDCLWSVLRQSLADLEVLVVDDRSPDRSRAVAELHRAGDHRVRVLQHRSNRGPAAARNTGLRVARGRYVTFVDGDDLVAESAFERLVGSLERTGSDFATSPIEDFGGRHRRRYWTNRGPEFRTRHERVSLLEAPGLVLDHSPVNKVFRRDFLLEFDLVWPEGTRHEDVWQATHAYARARAVDVVPEVGYFYRRRTGSETASLGTARMLADWASVTTEAMRVLREAGLEAARSVFARKALVDELLWRLPALTAAAASVPGTAALVRDLVASAPPRALAGQTAETRWAVALLALGREDLLTLVGGRQSSHPEPDLSGLDDDLPAELVTTLGLGDLTLKQAFRSRILGSPGPDLRETGHAAPTVSVVIPTHDVEEYLDETLRSIRASSYRALEILVVDDSSTDDAWDIIQRHSAEDPRLRAFRSPGRGGAQARNFAIEVATGEYLAFADGDDLVPPRAYVALVTAAERTGADITAGRYLHFHATQTWDPVDRYGYGIRLDGIEPADHTRLLGNRSSWDKLFRRDFWAAHRISFASVPRGNDILPLGVAFTSRPRLTVIPDVVYVYRTRPGAGSMTSRMKAGNDESIASWATQESVYARLIQLTAEPALTEEYWTRALPAHLRYNLRPYLAGRAEAAPEHDRVPTELASLLDAAPDGWLQRQEPALQGVLALLRRHELAPAAKLAAELWEGRRVVLAEALDVVEAVARTGLVDSEALSRLAWGMIVRRLLGAGERATLTDAQRAIEVSRALASDHHAVPATVPAGQEDLVSHALRKGSAEDVLGLLVPTAPITGAVFRSGWGSARLSGPAIPGAIRYLRVLAVRRLDGERVRLPLGRIVPAADGSGWTATLQTVAVPPGTWDLTVEYEDGFGLRRRQLRCRVVRLPAGLSRLARVSPASGGVTQSIVVRPSLWARVRRVPDRFSGGA
ncbi:MAG: glycosyltransferase family 2 protein [Propionicimonas sp.]|nr:glycosyltransferase family 2 protein [Propionicimonas sp.]